MSKKESHSAKIRPRLRITSGNDIALGPGKIELLEVLAQTGSITNAAKELGMSYMRAWSLIATMNRCFKSPLVAAVRGGTKGGGGARLTETGCEVLASYQRMTAKCLDAIEPDWRELENLLKH